MNRRDYSKVFMDDAVQMVQSGHSVKKVATELGIPHGTLWNWVQKAEGNGRARDRRGTPAEHPATEQEVHELRRRVSELEQENAFLGKVSAYFASKRRP